MGKSPVSEHIAIPDPEAKTSDIGIRQDGGSDSQSPETPIALPAAQGLGERDSGESVSQGGSHTSWNIRPPVDGLRLPQASRADRTSLGVEELPGPFISSLSAVSVLPFSLRRVW